MYLQQKKKGKSKVLSHRFRLYDSGAVLYSNCFMPGILENYDAFPLASESNNQIRKAELQIYPSTSVIRI